MPEPPGIIDRVNYVLRLWQNPCDAPWAVYAETALPAALQLVVTLASFGLDDIIRGYARPAGLRSGRHGRGGRRSGRRGGGIPEIGDEIGKRLPGRSQMRQRAVSDGVKHLWKADGVIQRGLWNWLLADALSEFAFDWTTQLYSTKYCEAADTSRAAYTDLSVGANAVTGWQGIASGIQEYSYGFPTTPGSLNNETTGTLACTLAATVFNEHSSPATYQVGAWRNITAGNPDVLGSVAVIPPLSTGSSIVTVDVPPGEALTWATSVSGAAAVLGVVGESFIQGTK